MTPTGPKVSCCHRTGLAEIDAIAWTEAKWQRRLSENEPFAALIQREGIAAERCGLTRE
jgi:hypothetical protein